ncbi:Hemin transport protein, partial [Xanthomonas perforans]
MPNLRAIPLPLHARATRAALPRP